MSGNNNLLLSHRSPEVLNFTTAVVETLPLPDARGYKTRLDETYFFPAGGGQPADRGSINGMKVDTVLEEAGQIWHYMDRDPGSGRVECSIDPVWRHHFMCQHTGQHIISGALWQVGRFKTLSVHMGEENTTIETDAEEIPPEQLHETEDLANEIVRSNLPVETIETHSDEVIHYPLRKPPPLTGPLHLVTVGSFDYSVCCGLHLATTGKIGLIKYLGTDKIRGHIRTSWLIGPPAYADYREKHRIVEQLKSTFSCGMEEMTQKAVLLLDEIRRLGRKLSNIEKRLADEWVRDILSCPQNGQGDIRIVSRLFKEDDALVTQVVKMLLEENHLVFCILNQAQDSFTWSIGCSRDLDLGFESFRNDLLTPFSAKGGGRLPLWKGISSSSRGTEFIDRFLHLALPHIRKKT